jgi:mannose-6-phosphate isomerase-like protein (cupin superfamily)
MKQTTEISKNNHYTAVNIGRFDQLADYELIHPRLKTTITGKLFLKEIIHSTGVEISFTTLPPRESLSYFHTHKKNEELYIVIKGAGYYQVDDDCFPIKEGSVVRVAPEGKRCLFNSSDEPLVYMVIQAKAGSLEEYTSDDGQRVPYEAKWTTLL